jgi:hypothetical protein
MEEKSGTYICRAKRVGNRHGVVVQTRAVHVIVSVNRISQGTSDYNGNAVYSTFDTPTWDGDEGRVC